MDIKSVLDERVIDLNMTAKNKKEAIVSLHHLTLRNLPSTQNQSYPSVTRPVRDGS